MKRAIVIVMDSVGIGYAPDADKYGDVGSDTLVNIKKAVPSMTLKNLSSLGVSSIDGEENAILGDTEGVKGAYGKQEEKSVGKDTTTGHWEMAGVVTKTPAPTFTATGFPRAFIEEFENAIGRKVIGNYAVSGTEIINRLGKEHMETGKPIVYTSADSVFQIAAHEDVIPVEKLYEICRTARGLLKGDLAVSRVIARPFVGKEGEFKRTSNRRDFSLLPPADTMLDVIKAQGLEVCAVGKIEDIFGGRGITKSVHTTDNADGVEKTLAYMAESKNGLIFTNLVDYDMLYGHRNDAQGYAKALEYFDKKLPEIFSAMRGDDMLIITADHGCDPTTPGTDHSREYVPILVYGENIKKGVNLGVLRGFDNLAATVCDYLGVKHNFEAKGFLDKIV